MVMNAEVASKELTPEEIAGAQAVATEVLQQGRINSGDSVSESRTLPGQIKPMTYHIPASDQGSWVLVWELAVDMDGEVYGTPTKAPRNQLGLWLEFKKRGDGGPRFTVTQPARVRAEPQYPCLHQQCPKRLYTRQDVVDHVVATHPREARIYKTLLEEIIQKAATDNPRVAEIARTIANTQERGVMSIAVDGSAPVPQELDTKIGTPVVTSYGIKVSDDDDGCASCTWKYKQEWSVRQRTQFLNAHIRLSHKEELETAQ